MIGIRSLLILALSVVKFAGTAFACSIFAYQEGDTFLFGNNEDYIEPGYLWFVPARRGHYGRVNVGFADGFVQGGMNERGRCFDAAALPEIPWENPDNKENPPNLIERIMDECATVAEALGYFERYHCRHLDSGQFLFADATGDAALVAGLPNGQVSVLRRTGPALIATNSRLELATYRCPRYVLAERMLGASTDTPMATARAALAAIHQQGPAAFISYTTIYEPAMGKVHVYNLANYDVVKIFDLAAELAKGKRKVALADLFGGGAVALAEIKAGAPIEYDTRITLDPADRARYAGRYQGNDSGRVGTIAAEGGELMLTNSAGERLALWPQGNHRFAFEGGGQVVFDAASDSIRGMTVYGPSGVSQATRIE